jgi:hypothetical protein
LSINNPQHGDKVIAPGQPWKRQPPVAATASPRERFISETSIENLNRPKRTHDGPYEPEGIGADYDMPWHKRYRSRDRHLRDLGMGAYTNGSEGPNRY